MPLYDYLTPKLDFKRKFNHRQSFLYKWRLTVRTIQKFRIGSSLRIESRIGSSIRKRIESRSFAGPYSKSSKNATNANVCGPNFFVEGTAPTFVRQLVRATYYPLLGKVWFSSVCWSPSAKPGNKAECRIYGGWVKWRSSLKPFVEQSSWHFGTMQETSRSCQSTWPVVYIMFRSEHISR